MSTSFTGKQRLGAVVATAWVVYCFFSIEPWKYSGVRMWEKFLALGIGPVAVILASIWVYRGFRNDKSRKKADPDHLDHT